MKAKKWDDSRTIHIAIAQAVLGTLIIVIETGVPWQLGLIFILKALLDAYLRFTTTDPIV